MEKAWSHLRLKKKKEEIKILYYTDVLGKGMKLLLLVHFKKKIKFKFFSLIFFNFYLCRCERHEATSPCTNGKRAKKK